MYNSLQIGRGIAAIMVMLLHLGFAISSAKYFNIPWIGEIFLFGDSGVKFFFVLSGFIIYSAHKNDLSSPKKLPEYLKKRIIRIYPTFQIIFLLVLFIAYFTTLRNTLPSDYFILIKAFFLIPQDPNIIGGNGSPVIDVAWTLKYEIIFYIFFAFLILNRLFSFILIFAYFLFYFNYANSYLYNIFYSPYMILFLFGIIVSIVQDLEIIHYKIIKFIGGLGLFMFIILIILDINQFVYSNNYEIILYGLSFSLIISYLVSIEKKGFDFSKYTLLNLIGNASYSLYLLHYPLIIAMTKVVVSFGIVKFGTISAISSFILFFIISIFTAILWHLKIEKPIIKILQNKFISKEFRNNEK